MAKLFLFDAMSIVFRAYHAMSRSGLKAPGGELTGAIYGFANILTTILTKENPEYVCIAFDTAEPTFRHKQFEEYKAHRPEFPEELVPQLARIKELIRALNIKQIEMPGYEADDIIGSIASSCSSPDVHVYCVTSDKDYCQLVNENTYMYRPSSTIGEYEIIDIAGVHKKFGVTPDKVIDVLALMGDASDNVPGVKGIGEKTAIPLVQEFGSLEGLYDNLDKVKRASVRTKLETHRDMAFLSKDLVTIHTATPVTATLEDYARVDIDKETLAALFDSLGFGGLRQRFGIEAPQNGAADGTAAGNGLATIETVEHEYALVNSEAKLQAMIEDLQSADALAFDTETTSINAMTCDIVGISFSAKPGTGFYVPLFRPDEAFTDRETPTDEQPDPVAQEELFGNETPAKAPPPAHQFDRAVEILERLKPLLCAPDIAKCGQNVKYDALVLKRYGVDVAPLAFDTMLASYLLDSRKKHNMDVLANEWLSYSPVSITTLIGEKKKEQKSMSELPVEQVSDYACEDADITLQLRNLLYDRLQTEELLELGESVEFPLIEVLTQIEYNGIALDTKALMEISQFIERGVAELKDKIFAETEQEFNIDSPKQLGHVLFEKMQIPPVKKTKTGYSTDSSVLEELARSYPVATYIVEYRQYTKLKSTYVDALPKLVNHSTGRIHSTFNQAVASTGRLASTDPNLQNIPIRTELGREIRRAFIPQVPENSIFSADYSQIELRIMAHISGDETLTHAFRHDLDIHAATAANLFGVTLENVDAEMRRRAKTVNFGIMYGLGAFGLAQRLGISRTESKEIIENYTATYPRIREYMDRTIEQAKEQGYVTTLLGRRRYFPDINDRNRAVRTAAERAAINMPIQGTAADMLKMAMINIHREMQRRDMRSKMMLQVHDELVFESVPGERETLPELVRSLMESALPLGDVPVVVSVGFGANWAEAH